METITQLVHLFLISVALGLTLFSFVANTKLTGVGFMKLLCSVCLGALTMSAGIHVFQDGPLNTISYLYYAALFCLGLTRFFHEDEKSPFMWLLYFVQNVAMFFIVFLKFNAQIIDYLFLISSVIFLGIITYAMTLGHWYLVVPKLSEKPLKVALLIFWAVFAVKALWTTSAVIGNWGFFESGSQLGEGYMFNWIMLSMRFGWGYLVLLVMSIFGWKLVRMRSIQSATGIFYAMVFFVFIGELISGYFFLKHGVYI